MRVFKEAIRSLHDAPKYSILLFILFVISFTAITISVSSNEIVSSESEHYQNTFGNIEYYKLNDNLVGEAEERFFSGSNKIERFKRFYNALSNNKNFEYFEVYLQPIEVESFAGDVNCLNGYDGGYYESHPLSRELTLPDGYSGMFSTVKTIWLGQTVFSHFDLDIEGRGFTDTEYQYLSGSRFPVILGAAYKNVYDIGDTFHTGAMIDCGEAVVIGFLQKGAHISSGRGLVNLDTYMVLPMYNDKSIIEDEDDYGRQLILYLMKINGILASDKYTPNELQEMVNIMCEDCGITPSSYIDGATNSQSYLLGLSIEEILEALSHISSFIVVYACLALSVFMYSKTKKKLKYYAILSVCGFSITEINLVIILEICIFIFLSNISALMLSGAMMSIARMPFPESIYGYIIFVDFLIILVSVVSPTIVLRRSDMAVYFRKK